MTDNMHEYIVKQKNEGQTLFKKIALAAAYPLMAILLAIINITVAPEALQLLRNAIIVLFTVLVAFITWRFVCVEYEFIISGGDITVTAIYGKGFRKRLISMSINSFSEIGEYNDAAFEAVSKLSLQKNYICISSLSAPNVYYALFEEKGELCILYFDATQKAVELLKRHNSGAFRAGNQRIKNF